MADIVDAATRSKMMSRIRSKNTKPELYVRKKLFHEGFRYRIHENSLPGKPDLVLRKYKAVILVHGCFWHGHQGCRLFKLPESKKVFWTNKISRNISNDTKVTSLLLNAGWRVAIVWECGIRNKANAENYLFPALCTWIRSQASYFEFGLNDCLNDSQTPPDLIRDN